MIPNEEWGGREGGREGRPAFRMVGLMWLLLLLLLLLPAPPAAGAAGVSPSLEPVALLTRRRAL